VNGARAATRESAACPSGVSAVDDADIAQAAG
jgi:hypothetical protein